MMTTETEKKLAASLSAETTDILPFLPYLLQDFWELGSDPGVIADLIRKYIKVSGGTKILDLACGKGAASIKVAQELKINVKGIDIFPEFIDYAIQKASKANISSFCEFIVGDINDAIIIEKNYDCVIFGAAGTDVLGGPRQALEKLKSTVKPGGYIIIDEGYISDESEREKLKYNSETYFTLQYWMELFDENGLELIETVSELSEIEHSSTPGINEIIARANELSQKHPGKKALFEGYIQSQQNEYNDIDDTLICATWLLRRV